MIHVDDIISTPKNAGDRITKEFIVEHMFFRSTTEAQEVLDAFYPGSQIRYNITRQMWIIYDASGAEIAHITTSGEVI